MSIIDRRGITVGEEEPADSLYSHSGLSIKAPVLVATTANITLSGLQTIDGITVVADDRVLVKDQSTASLNGIYNASSGSWVRSGDMDGAGEVAFGTRIFVVAGGSANGLTEWYVSSANPISIGTSNIAFTQLVTGGAPASATFLTLSLSATLTNERVLTAGTAIGFTDGGAGSTLTVSLTDAELLALAGLTSAADKVAYFTGLGTAALGDFTSYGRSLVAVANEAAFKALVNLEAGTDFNAYDATLAALSSYNTTGFLVQTATDTFTGRTLAAPAAGFTITNPAGTAGDPTFVLADDLAGLEGMSGTGHVVRTGSGTYAQRTLTAPAAGFSITDGSGVSGNPTFVLANDLAALEAMSGTGIVARTTSETYAQRTITGTTNKVSVTNGDGVSGNPTLNVGSLVSQLDTAQEYTATHNFNATALTSTSAAIAWDLAANQVVIHTATENTTLSAPTNQVQGATYIFIFVQHASSPKTLAFHSTYKFKTSDPTVTASNSAIDVLVFVSDGTNMLGVATTNFV